MTRLPLYWVDAFTSKVFAGNPAAVVPLDQWLDDALMQRIAFENGLAETAFFVPAKPPSEATAAGPHDISSTRSAKEGRYHLRWFTPALEVDLCGHATLASAYVLFTQLGLAGDLVTYDSRSGPLSLRSAQTICSNSIFPAAPHNPAPPPPPWFVPSEHNRIMSPKLATPCAYSPAPKMSSRFSPTSPLSLNLIPLPSSPPPPVATAILSPVFLCPAPASMRIPSLVPPTAP